MTLALGGHGRHLDGVGGEGGEPCHFVLLRGVGQIMGHPCVGPVELLPGDAIAWRKRDSSVSAERSRDVMFARRLLMATCEEAVFLLRLLPADF